MADLRLTGSTVHLARNALSFGPIARVFWAITSRDFKIPELLRLPAADRLPFEAAPIPIRGRALHQWEDAGLDAPTPTNGRESGAVLRGAYAQGLSPVDVLDRIVKRHEVLGPRSPFIVLDPERARRAAKASADRWKAGAPKGPMDGLPVPVKDEFHLRGLPTRGGTKYLNDPVDADAWVVTRLEQAGAVVVGKTHATEFGLNPLGVLEHHVGPRNAYHPERAPGGSSTGSGVAVALGMCPSAVGTDGGGSIRVPAALNGVFGIKPTYIRVGRTGDAWGASSVAHIGPIGQTVEDLVDQLEATAGIDPDDPFTRWAIDGHDSGAWRKALGRGVKGCRIGVPRAELAEAHPRIADGVLAALAALQKEGAILVDVALPLAPMAQAMGALIIGGETAANVRDAYRANESAYGDELTIFIKLMALVGAQEMLLAGRTRVALRHQMAALFRDVDIVALPTLARVAAAYEPSLDRTPILDTGATASMTRFNFLGNLTGLPAGTVPIGVSTEEPGTPAGLPYGLQLVGDAWDEASVFAVMAHAERIGLADGFPRPPAFASLRS